MQFFAKCKKCTKPKPAVIFGRLFFLALYILDNIVLTDTIVSLKKIYKFEMSELSKFFDIAVTI